MHTVYSPMLSTGVTWQGWIQILPHPWFTRRRVEKKSPQMPCFCVGNKRDRAKAFKWNANLNYNLYNSITEIKQMRSLWGTVCGCTSMHELLTSGDVAVFKMKQRHLNSCKMGVSAHLPSIKVLLIHSVKVQMFKQAFPDHFLPFEQKPEDWLLCFGETKQHMWETCGTMLYEKVFPPPM